MKPTTLKNDQGTVPLGVKMRVGYDDVTVEKKVPVVQAIA